MNTILKIGEVFEEKYKIEEILGSGGIGTVYRAVQLDCQRNVALKILHQYALDDEYQARFIQEAQALSRLSHANVVTVYNLGLSQSGIPYLVMEYVKGQNVRRILSSVNRMPVLQALRIVRDAARALACVHEHGIVHRDLKPENILLTPVPEPDTVKIVDFGLARLANPQNQEQKLTSTGELIGTSAYMSPEQCKGRAVDSRTDVYSLTACLYEMIVGRRPFDSENPVGVIYKHLNDPVPAILASQVDLFHPALNKIVSQGMAKEAAMRFANMEEMANRIDETISLVESAGKENPGRNVRQCQLLPFSFLLCSSAEAAYSVG
jgi:serine/threonine protein kinase